MSAPTLQVLICTFGAEGLRRVAAMALPEIEGVGYLVSCQDPSGEVGGDGILPQRSDIQLFIHKDKGLGLNRRHAMEHATGEFVLLADDDLVYDAAALEAAMGIMKGHPGLDIFAFRYSGADDKIYPPGEHDLGTPYKNYNITSFELAFRRGAVERIGVRFSTLLGVGAPYLTAGEESVFLEWCLQAGLRGRFFPLTIVAHPGETTGFRAQTRPGVIRSTAAHIRIKYGVGEGLLRCILLARRLPVGFFKAFRYAVEGMVYSIRHDREL